MTAKQKTKRRDVKEKPQAGFSILELILASAILMVGIISVVQLVPASLQLNANNRFDTMATVIAQRELDQMLNQPLTVDSFVDKKGNEISLGDANASGASGASGASPFMDGQTAVIDFSPGSGTPPQGYYLDLSDYPGGPTFELRWAVISEVNSGKVISRRIIIGCKRTNSSQPTFPVTLDTWIEK
jgi:hypothetical protein